MTESDSFVTLRGENWFAERLKPRGVDVMAGTTTAAERKQRIRDGIRQNGLGSVVAGSKDGKPVTYQDAFVRLFGEPL